MLGVIFKTLMIPVILYALIGVHCFRSPFWGIFLDRLIRELLEKDLHNTNKSVDMTTFNIFCGLIKFNTAIPWVFILPVVVIKKKES